MSYFHLITGENILIQTDPAWQGPHPKATKVQSRHPNANLLNDTSLRCCCPLPSAPTTLGPLVLNKKNMKSSLPCQSIMGLDHQEETEGQHNQAPPHLLYPGCEECSCHMLAMFSARK